MTTKAKYVLAQPQTRKHLCHWPGCTKQVPPAMWGCRNHWFTLPSSLRKDLWNAYRPGQEIDMNPSREYLEAVRQIKKWIIKHEKNV